MFALALHSRRENEKKALQKRRATISAGRLHQRASQITLEDSSKSGGGAKLVQQGPSSITVVPDQQQSPTNADGIEQQNKKSIAAEGNPHRLLDKSRSYSAITVIRTKAPESILSAAGLSTLASSAPSNGGRPIEDTSTKPPGSTDSLSSATVLRESGPRVLFVRMTPEQHKATASRLRRQMTQPAIHVHQIPEVDESGGGGGRGATTTVKLASPIPLVKKLSK